MRFKQNSVFSLSLFIILVHYLFAGYDTGHCELQSDQVVIQVSPDNHNPEVIKPANSLSIFSNKVEMDWITKWVSQVDVFVSTLIKSKIEISFLPQKVVPIFLSYCTMRI